MPGPTIKTTLAASGSGATTLTLGELKTFVAKADEAGMSDHATIRASSYSDQRDHTSGWSLIAEEGH